MVRANVTRTERTIKTLSLATALALSVAACGTDDPSLDSSLTIENDSSYTFVEINLSPDR